MPWSPVSSSSAAMVSRGLGPSGLRGLAGLDAKIRHVNDDSDHGQTIIVEAAAAS